MVLPDDGAQVTTIKMLTMALDFWGVGTDRVEAQGLEEAEVRRVLLPYLISADWMHTEDTVEPVYYVINRQKAKDMMLIDRLYCPGCGDDITDPADLV
jgi:hypothetical protein